MIKIAVVEDCNPFRNRILNEINSSQCANRLDSIDIFSNAEDFLKASTKVSYQIIILDIELPDMNGIDLSRHLLNISKDVTIIFLTSYENYALDAFGLNVHKYIMKDQMENKLVNAIIEIINKKNSEKRNNLLVRTYDRELVVDEDDIICIVYEDRHPTIYTINEKIVVIGSSLEKMYNKLSMTTFVQPNNGTIINFKYVKSLSSKIMILKNYDSLLTVSRGRYELVKKSYMNYLMLGGVINNG